MYKIRKCKLHLYAIYLKKTGNCLKIAHERKSTKRYDHFFFVPKRQCIKKLGKKNN